MKVGQLVEITHAKPEAILGQYYKEGDTMRINHVWESQQGVDATDALGISQELYNDEFKVMNDQGEADNVNSPNHYNTGRFETIELIEAVTSGYTDGYQAYCIGNALKYISRAPFKHGSPVEDMRKAAKYLEFAIEALQRGEGNEVHGGAK